MSEETEERAVDLARPLGELTADDPAVGEILGELGFEEPSGDATIPELCEAEGVDVAIVAMALTAYGYEVRGYESPDGGEAAGALGQILGHLFSPDEDDGAAASAGPMYSHMEAAIRRAQRDGTLPREDDGASE